MAIFVAASDVASSFLQFRMAQKKSLNSKKEHNLSVVSILFLICFSSGGEQVR